jgi:hypothetical protein
MAALFYAIIDRMKEMILWTFNNYSIDPTKGHDLLYIKLLEILGKRHHQFSQIGLGHYNNTNFLTNSSRQFTENGNYFVNLNFQTQPNFTDDDVQYVNDACNVIMKRTYPINRLTDNELLDLAFRKELIGFHANLAKRTKLQKYEIIPYEQNNELYKFLDDCLANIQKKIISKNKKIKLLSELRDINNS